MHIIAIISFTPFENNINFSIINASSTIVIAFIEFMKATLHCCKAAYNIKEVTEEEGNSKASFVFDRKNFNVF